MSGDFAPSFAGKRDRSINEMAAAPLRISELDISTSLGDVGINPPRELN
jgi:hypothetical protein